MSSHMRIAHKRERRITIRSCETRSDWIKARHDVRRQSRPIPAKADDIMRSYGWHRFGPPPIKPGWNSQVAPYGPEWMARVYCWINRTWPRSAFAAGIASGAPARCVGITVLRRLRGTVRLVVLLPIGRRRECCASGCAEQSRCGKQHGGDDLRVHGLILLCKASGVDRQRTEKVRHPP